MGYAKRMMEEHEDKLSAAMKIALDARVLKHCEFHDDYILETGEDIAEAYRVGNARFTEGRFGDVFASRREMTDCIKEVVEEQPDECYLCAKVHAE